MEHKASRSQYYMTAEESNSPKVRLARAFVRHFEVFCLCDRDSLHQWIKRKWRTRKKFKRPSSEREQELSTSATMDVELKRIWPLIVLAFYIATSVYLLVWLRFQFEYDFYSTKLDRLRDSASEVRVDAALERSFERHVNSSYRTLKILGDPWVNLKFCNQATILLILMVAFFSYPYLQLMSNYEPESRMFLFDLLLDEASEFRKCELLIRRETEAVINSSRNCVKAAMQLGLNELGRATHKGAAPAAMMESNEGEQLGARLLADCPRQFGPGKLYRDHLIIVRQLELFVDSARLHPINRASAEWRNQLITTMLQANMANTLYRFVVDLAIVLLGDTFTRIQFEFKTRMDYAFVPILWLYIQVGTIASTYHVPALLIHCRNQAHYVGHLSERVRETIAANERELASDDNHQHHHHHHHHHDSPPDLAHRRRYEHMNSRLLQVYLEYRVFLGQLAGFKVACRRVIEIGLLSVFVFPLLIRLYGPYIGIGMTKSVITTFTFNCIIFMNLLLIPVCHFESKGRALYRKLWSLFAHALAANDDQTQSSNGAGIYMENTIQMIRKELDHPEQVLGHFLTQHLGITANFSSLMELHFYYSVLNLALFCEVEAWRRLLGDRLDDPFSILKD